MGDGKALGQTILDGAEVSEECRDEPATPEFGRKRAAEGMALPDRRTGAPRGEPDSLWVEEKKGVERTVPEHSGCTVNPFRVTVQRSNDQLKPNGRTKGRKSKLN